MRRFGKSSDTVRVSSAADQLAKHSAMHVLSLYLDTSVIGGDFDVEFMADTPALWRQMEAGRFRFVSSVLVDQEISRAPESVRRLIARPLPRLTSCR